MEHKTISINQSYDFAWGKFKEKALFFIGLGILSAVLGSLGQNSPMVDFDGDNFSYDGGGISTISFLAMLINSYIGLGIWKICINHIKGEEVQLNDLISISFGQFIHYIIATIITIIATLVGLVLLIIPGIHICCRLLLVPGYIADQNLSFDNAIKSSWNATKGHTMKLFLWILLSIFVFILGLIALIVGVFAAIPVISLALAYIYVQLSDNRMLETQE